MGCELYYGTQSITWLLVLMMVYCVLGSCASSRGQDNPGRFYNENFFYLSHDHCILHNYEQRLKEQIRLLPILLCSL